MQSRKVGAPPPEPQSEQTIPLHVEEVSADRGRATTSVVRVATVTRTRDQIVDEPVIKERVEIERTPVGRLVDAVPEVREEGGVTIVPVVEEVVVVERRLRLKEEIRIRRVRTTERHQETVQLREQEAVVSRHPANEESKTASASSLGPTTESEHE